MDTTTLFINISNDNISILNSKININLPHSEIENKLWPKLVQIIRELWISNIIVLNWPWWFTNLRVGTLCLNILNALMNDKLNLYSISKISLYQKTYESWILPNKWIIYIGQKKNIWLWDFEKWEKIWQYSFDELKEKIDHPVFLDEVVDENYYPDRLKKYNKIKISFNWNELHIENWNDSINFSIDDLDLKPLKSISPNYMIEPSVTLK